MPPRLTDCKSGLIDSVKSGGGLVTVTDASPCTKPLVAVTVDVPGTDPAVNRPVESIEPTPVTDQVNEGCGFISWPFWSVPVALNCFVPPVVTDALDGDTVMVVRTGGAVTVTAAVPCTEPLVAVTVNGPPAVEPAVNRPAWLTVPPPLTDQVNEGCGFIGWPFWSSPVALHCFVPPAPSEALDGEIVMEVSTGEATAVAMLPRPVGPSQPTPAWPRTAMAQEPFDPDVTSKYGVLAAHAYLLASRDEPRSEERRVGKECRS